MLRLATLCRHCDRSRSMLPLLAFVAIVLPVFALANPKPVGSAPSVPTLESDWSRDMWEVTGGMFFSGYSSIDEYLNATAYPANRPPLTADYQRKTEHLRADAVRDPALIDPNAKCHVCGAGCLPYGVPLVLTMPEPFKFQFSPGMVVVLSKQGYRKILTNTRKHPRDWDPTYGGHSVGRWERGTLVIDTVGISDKTVIEPGLPHSDRLHVVEHWRQIEPDKLQNRIVISDPNVLTHSWVVTKTYRRLVGLEPQEKPCM
jgi:hypothetical protein